MSVSLSTVGASALGHLPAGSVVAETLLGVVVALVLFSLYYVLVLRRAKRGRDRRPTDERGPRNGT